MADVAYSPDSTQQFVDIDDIRDDVVFLRDGSLRSVIMVSGTNFELKSEDEQDGIISAYQSFLNALDFSVQIVVHSRKLNVDLYLKKMEGVRDKEPNELLKNQIGEYIEFIRGFVKENEIMTKNFFVVVPYEGVNLQSLKKGFLGMFSLGSKPKKAEADESEDQKILQLRQRVDEVVSGLERVGLRAVSLNREELLELYYNLYNPETVEKNIPLEKNA